MIASVGSGGRSGASNVATLLNNGSGAGCYKRPQLYHSATISRRTFAAPPPAHYYYMQYPQQQQQQAPPYLCKSGNCQNSNCVLAAENGGNCCNSSSGASCCCYAPSAASAHSADAQQRNALRIYSSQSATNIFGNVCLPQQQIQHMQCANAGNSSHLAPYCIPQSQFANNTLTRNTPRCAALRVQRQPPQLSLIKQPQLSNTLNDFIGHAHTDENSARHAAWQQTQGSSYCTMPYEYEEIGNPCGAPQTPQLPKFSTVCNAMRADANGFEDAENTTVFEDLSEDLRQIEAKKQLQQQQSQQQPPDYHLPPPATRPPPIPAKRTYSANNKQQQQQHASPTTNHWRQQSSPSVYQVPPNNDSNSNYQVPPNNGGGGNEDGNVMSSRRAPSTSSASSVDAELQRFTAVSHSTTHLPSSNPTNRLPSFDYDEEEKMEDRTCDDATSLANSMDGGGGEVADELASGRVPPHQYPYNSSGGETTVGVANRNGRESGYGTGKSRRTIVCHNSESSPHLQHHQRFSVTR